MTSRLLPRQQPERRRDALTLDDLLMMIPPSPPIAEDDERNVIALLAEEGRSRPVLDWAAQESVHRRAPLTIIQSLPRHLTFDPFGIAGFDVWGDERASARDALRHAIAYVESQLGSATATGLVVSGSSPSAVAALTGNTGLIVTDRAGRKNVGRLLFGELGWEVARHAPQPVVLVNAGIASMPGFRRSDGFIVVLVSDRTNPIDPLGFALRAARRSTLGVNVVHVATSNSGGDYFARADVDDVFRAAQDAFPDVRVTRRSGVGDPRVVLSREAVRTRLVVVSARGSSRQFRALRTGRLFPDSAVAVV